MKLTRRNFLRSAASASGAALLGRDAWSTLHAFGGQRDLALPPPSRSGIEHVVVVMMENRSFDHLLGWLPNADGRQAGLTYLDAAGFPHETHALAPDYTGCRHPDPDHSYDGGRLQYDDGQMDGFVRSGSNDDYAIGYYVEADLPGFKKNEIDVTLENQTLTISAEHREETKQGDEKKGDYLLRERRYNRFMRSFTLPPTVDDQQVQAKLNDGILTITLNKREETKPRKVQVG